MTEIHQPRRAPRTSTWSCAACATTSRAGRARTAFAGAVARLDGHRRHVPVPRGCDVRPALVCRTGLAWLRPHRVAGRRLLVPGLLRRPRCAARPLVAGRAGHADRPQHGRQHRDAVAGIRPERVRRVVCIEGFGLSRSSPSRRPAAIESGCGSCASRRSSRASRRSMLSRTCSRGAIRAWLPTARDSSRRHGRSRPTTAAFG